MFLERDLTLNSGAQHKRAESGLLDPTQLNLAEVSVNELMCLKYEQDLAYF